MTTGLLTASINALRAQCSALSSSPVAPSTPLFIGSYTEMKSVRKGRERRARAGWSEQAVVFGGNVALEGFRLAASLPFALLYLGEKSEQLLN